ncbi:MAG: RNA-binding transcriptional accessory protein [Vicinamibacteria bacterium]|nr:RNA-binding transcriptional accessory protein [Vicinamibacteria bacterium]
MPTAATFESYLRTHKPQIPLAGANAVLELAAEGSTIPFIARYRKERTGNLDEVAIAAVIDLKEEFDELEKRRAFVREEIEKQGKLTPELSAAIAAAGDRLALEDLYLPYKRKRRTKAALAREAGLEPLADWIWNCGHGTEQPQEGQTLELWAFTFRNAEKEIESAERAIEGARDILVERLSERQDLRQTAREALFGKAVVRTEKGEKAKAPSKYDRYFDYREAVSSLLKPEHSHRFLALRRGFVEEELKLKIEAPPEDPDFDARLVAAFEGAACTVADSPGAAVLREAGRLALFAYVKPSLEAEVLKELKTIADSAAIDVFAANVRELLLAPPMGPQSVIGVDPGVRTGCKVAAVDASGRYVESAVFKTQTEEQKQKAKQLLAELLERQPPRAFAVGNGTAGRETERFLRDTLREVGKTVPVVLVSEAGASVYSASPIAREEFPDLDLTVRGAISIARRLQDPLAELVKIDPKSIGVGQYQHDVNPNALKRALERVVDSCVNAVGVDLNTASRPLLARVSGIGEALASALVEHREKNGLFKSRRQLLDVKQFGARAFEQAAGFLRVRGGDEPLDQTGVHPERYEALRALAQTLGKEVTALLGSGSAVVREHVGELARAVGEFTAMDVIGELEKPGRDPRQTFVPLEFREDLKELKDLQPGMECPGVVTNVTNFGAFVDIGVHHDGLVHVSQLGTRFFKDPREAVKPGDHVKVRVLSVDLEKGQFSLSMRPADEPKRHHKPRPKGRPERKGGDKPKAAGATAAPGTAAAAPGGDARPRRRPGRKPEGPREGAAPAAGGPPSSGPRPGGGPRPGSDRGPRRDDRGRGERPSGPPSVGARPGPRPAFNNPFAALLGNADKDKKS